jgi:UDP-N-acetylglucosamine acyltransferase
MNRIHSTAFVSPQAALGEGTQIGPYCVVGPDVRLGRDCVLHSHVTLDGPTEIGDGNHFFPFCSIGFRSQDLKYRGEPTYLQIGHRNSFREFCTLNRGTDVGSRTTVGDDNHFLAYAHVAHDCSVGNHVIFSNNGTIAGHVLVEDHAVVGGLSAVHQFCRIGRHAILGGCTKIVQDVPPFTIADGNPAEIRGINKVGLERKGFSPEQLRNLKEAYRIIWRTDLNVRQACESIREKLPDTVEIQTLLTFIESSQRGIIR